MNEITFLTTILRDKLMNDYNIFKNATLFAFGGQNEKHRKDNGQNRCSL